jgi:transposase
MNRTTIAVDLAKSVFQLAVANAEWRVVERHRLTRMQLLRFFGEHQPCAVVMEACGSAHFWGRWLQSLGFQVTLLPPQYVRAYVRRNKTDRADADALLEAARCAELVGVPVKSEQQQALASLHRLRSGWQGTRTARSNAVRGILREFGVTIPRGAQRVVRAVHALLDDPGSPVPPGLYPALTDACEEIRQLEERIEETERQLERLAAELPVVAQLRSIPGIGLLTATALVAAVGDVLRFPSGRHLASWLGLTPREYSSGGVRRLGGISKRGDRYLRTLLIHGGRSVLLAAHRKKQVDGLRAWALRVERQHGHNKAAVALANKLARIAWAVWRRGESFQSRPLETAACSTTPPPPPPPEAVSYKNNTAHETSAQVV